jgi:uncharacterized protein YaiI (UPF0178 family)
MMKIWVDADACPLAIKEILYRAAERTKTTLILVANLFLNIPASPYINRIQVLAGFDVADKMIIQRLTPGDLVITADIPLADEVIAKGGIALNPRGQLYSQANIKQRLAIRNLNEGLRDSGIISGGPGKLSKREVQDFANNLDRILTSNAR